MKIAKSVCAIKLRNLPSPFSFDFVSSCPDLEGAKPGKYGADGDSDWRSTHFHIVFLIYFFLDYST